MSVSDKVRYYTSINGKTHCLRNPGSDGCVSGANNAAEACEKRVRAAGNGGIEGYLNVSFIIFTSNPRYIYAFDGNSRGL